MFIFFIFFQQWQQGIPFVSLCKMKCAWASGSLVWCFFCKVSRRGTKKHVLDPSHAMLGTCHYILYHYIFCSLFSRASCEKSNILGVATWLLDIILPWVKTATVTPFVRPILPQAMQLGTGSNRKLGQSAATAGFGTWQRLQQLYHTVSSINPT